MHPRNLGAVLGPRVAALMVAAYCCPASAGWMDGNELLLKLKSKQESESVLAFGYVLGVADARAGAELRTDDSLCFSLPTKARAGQIVDTVRVRLEEVPESRHLPAATLIRLALSVSYPCAK